ncbi:MAG TPA: hypothetical protein PLP99_11435 [Ignavibacteriales bacterium]|nr:hypothetical protein [Ignavibacteriales bacterium]HOL82348.1 hypothetical protein [Ignavibacteriales bacterium]
MKKSLNDISFLDLGIGLLEEYCIFGKLKIIKKKLKQAILWA